MQFESVDLDSVEKELQEKITGFELISEKFLVNKESNKPFQEMIGILKSLYGTVLQIKDSQIIAHNYKHRNTLLLVNDVNPDFLTNLQLLSLKLQVSPSKIINTLMSGFLSNHERKNKGSLEIDYEEMKQKFLKNKLIITLSSKEYLEILSSDLADPEIIYSFYESEIVIFKDITADEFQNKIGTISNCKTVFIPNNIPKLLIYSKVKDTNSVQIYDSLDDVYDAILVFK